MVVRRGLVGGVGKRAARSFRPAHRPAAPSPPPPSFSPGTFKLTLDFSEEYPNRPPTVKFASPIFHPNVYADGGICLDILQNQWTPIYDVSAVLTSVQSLLADPNPASPANSEAARLFGEDRREYNRRVRAVVDASMLVDGEEEEEEEEEKDEEEGGEAAAAAAPAAAPAAAD